MPNVNEQLGLDNLKNASGSLAAQAPQAPQAIQTTVELITPEKAGQYLLANTHNRHILEGRVAGYADDMNAGRFGFNGDPIRFDSDGVLLDGQHRLRACVRAKSSFWSVVIRGLSPQAQFTIDIGAHRTSSQMMTLQGIKNARTTTSIARLLLVYQRTPTFADFGQNGLPTVVEVTNYGLDHWAELQTAVAITDKMNSITRNATIGGCCHHLFSKIDEQRADQFFEQLIPGAVVNTSPIFQLRDRLMKAKSGHTYYVRRELFALYFKAWNLYLEGRPCKLLYWRRGEEFPVLEPRETRAA